MENLNIALLLLVVGLITVFAILLIVIYLGKLLIYLVGKYVPEEAAAPKQSPRPAPVPPQILAVITAAVNVVTSNKGKVVEVKRQDKP